MNTYYVGVRFKDRASHIYAVEAEHYEHARGYVLEAAQQALTALVLIPCGPPSAVELKKEAA